MEPDKSEVRAVLEKYASREVSDAEREVFVLGFGLKRLACILDGLDPTRDYLLKEFSKENHYAHLLFRGVHEDDLETARL